MGKRKSAKSGRPGASLAEISPLPSLQKSLPEKPVSSSPGFFSSSNFEWLALTVASAISYWILTARLNGVSVSVLVDEYIYVLDAHYRSLSEADFPNHLFQLIYGATKSCGAEFYSCARGLNAVFVVLSAVVIYFLAKEIAKRKWVASIVWVGVVFGSFSTYTAYFMPEVVFNFLMVIFFFGLFKFGQSQNLLVWSGLGAVLGIAALAKPHALFVVPAILIYIFLATRSTQPKYMVELAKRLSSFSAALLMSKLGIGFLIAGPGALSLFGRYGGVTVDADFISSSAALVENTILAESTLSNIFVTAWGQTLLITMTLGLSLLVSVSGLFSAWTKNAEQFLQVRYRALFALSLLNMMAVVALFEAWLNIVHWMHTRYYTYLIPLAIVVLVEAYIHHQTRPKRIVQRILVGIFVGLSLVVLFTRAAPYEANWVDSPDFKAHLDNIVLSSIAITVSVLLALWWIRNAKTSMLLGLFFATLAAVASGTHVSAYLDQTFGQDSVHSHLGRVLRDYLPQDELDKTILVGDSAIAMERALFGSLSGGAGMQYVGEGSIQIDQLPADRIWLVRVGDIEMDGLPKPQLIGNGFELYSIGAEGTSYPRNNQLSTFSNACSEISNADWVCGSSTKISLQDPFARRSRVDLIIEVPENSAGKEMVFSIGGSSLVMAFEVGNHAFSIEFTNPTQEQELGISLKEDLTKVLPSGDKLLRIISANEARDKST
jgi:phosphoglycerol transferase